MRTAIKLLRDGQPLDDLSDGDQVTFELNTGEVVQIVNSDGKTLWQSRREPEGKLGRMVAVRAK